MSILTTLLPSNNQSLTGEKIEMKTFSDAGQKFWCVWSQNFGSDAGPNFGFLGYDSKKFSQKIFFEVWMNHTRFKEVPEIIGISYY